jgi:hypothetical protein
MDRSYNLELTQQNNVIEFVDQRPVIDLSAPGPQGPIGYVEGGVPANPEWSSILNKPTSFPPSTHTHAWETITNKPVAFTPVSHTHVVDEVIGLNEAIDTRLETLEITWDEVIGKPISFTPSVHTHVKTDITGLQSELDSKLNVSDLTWNNVSGKPTSFVPSAHTHDWTQVTSKPTEFPPSSHTHAWADIAGKPSSFNPAVHTHNISDVTGLQAVLDAKAEDSAVVKLTGNQTIAGIKSFSSAPKLGAASTTGYVWTATGTDGSGAWAAAAGGASNPWKIISAIPNNQSGSANWFKNQSSGTTTFNNATKAGSDCYFLTNNVTFAFSRVMWYNASLFNDRGLPVDSFKYEFEVWMGADVTTGGTIGMTLNNSSTNTGNGISIRVAFDGTTPNVPIAVEKDGTTFLGSASGVKILGWNKISCVLQQVGSSTIAIQVYANGQWVSYHEYTGTLAVIVPGFLRYSGEGYVRNLSVSVRNDA